jgi:hypothetical protein
VYELDQIATEVDHLVIRLPPYNCHCNPIKIIWAELQGEVTQPNSTVGLSKVKRFMNEATDSD